MSKFIKHRKVDFLVLCEQNVQSIEVLANSGNLLNQRQCLDLSSKLSKTSQNIRELVSGCGASASHFRPALENLYRYLEKAKVLLSKCGERDWCAAAVFQCRNENAFREILLEVGLCYNAIYEQAKSTSDKWNVPPDLRQTSEFLPATASDVQKDHQDLQKRLEDLVNEPHSVNLSDHFLPEEVALKQYLARYLLRRLNYTVEKSEATTLDTCSATLELKDTGRSGTLGNSQFLGGRVKEGGILDTCRASLRANETEPSGTWGKDSHFLGAGAGTSGVCSIKWMGIPCAKKEFHKEYERIFLKEAGILAHLKHPCVVNFFCCGNWHETENHFIAMELMEMSLFKLIEDQKKNFSLPVVLDIIVQIARGMCYLHDQGVAHRDLKPKNVVVNKLTYPDLEDHFCVKLVDFGASKTKLEVLQSNTISYRGVGTTMYRAPEVYPNASLGRNGRAVWFKADVFSFAMTCVHVLSLNTPFGDVDVAFSVDGLYNALMNGHRPTLPVPDKYHEELVELLKECWNTIPRKRPSFMDICIRLEKLRHKVLRESSNRRMPAKKLEFGTGLDFIETKIAEQSCLQKASVTSTNYEVEGDNNRNDVVSIVPCTSGHALKELPRAPYESGPFLCNMCADAGTGKVYHCETCQYDAHSDCAEIKDKVKVFFHDHLLHLLAKNYYHNDLETTCRFCDESVQDSEWVYRCEQCDLDVHVLCTKYPKEMMHSRHSHLFTLIQCPPRKSLICAICNANVRGHTWRYVCTKFSCAVNVHPFCATLPWNPLCIFDNSHRFSLIYQRKRFHCGSCNAPGLSAFYHCEHCDVDIHLDCLDDIEDKDDWNMAYDKFMLECGTKNDHMKMDMISDLLDRLQVSDTLKVSSSSRTSPAPVTMMVRPTIQRLTPSEKYVLDAFDDVDLHKKIDAGTLERKAKKMAAKEARQKSKANLPEMLENLERIVLDMESFENISKADVEVLAATHKKLKKGKYLALEVQSKMRHGPRVCLFYKRDEGRGANELLTSLRADMKDVRYLLLCEEPGHEHIVRGSKVTLCNGVLGEERLGILQPLLSSGLQVVTRAMSTLGEQLPQLECATLPILGDVVWDLRAIDLEKHGGWSREASEDEENVECLKRAEDSAAEYVLSSLESFGLSVYESRGLLRVRYIVNEEGKCPQYKRGTLAWLCSDHFNRGLEVGRLEPYPVKYYNEQRRFLIETVSRM